MPRDAMRNETSIRPRWLTWRATSGAHGESLVAPYARESVYLSGVLAISARPDWTESPVRCPLHRSRHLQITAAG